MGYTTLDIGIPSPIANGIGVGVGNGVGVAVAPGTGVGVIVGVGVGAAAGTGVGVGTAVADGTGRATPFGRVIVAVIDHDVPRTAIVPVLPFGELRPPSITVDPATVGKAVTVMVVPWSYLPDPSGAGLKTNKPFVMLNTVWFAPNAVPFTDSCIPWGFGVGPIVGFGVGPGVGVGQYLLSNEHA